MSEVSLGTPEESYTTSPGTTTPARVQYRNGRRYLDGLDIDHMKTDGGYGIAALMQQYGGYENANAIWLQEADEVSKDLYRRGLLGGGISIPRFEDEDLEAAGANPIQGNVYPSESDDEVDSISYIFGDAYRSIVQGWNQKVVSNNVDLSSLTPFVELYAVFASNDIVYSDSINRFSGIKNRLIPVRFVAPPNSIAGSIPALPANVTQDSKLARIGSVQGQLNNDYINYSNSVQSGGQYPPTNTVKSFKGQPGINDLSISRGSSGAFNIKYDIGITLPNPEILNDQYEYSKLLLPNSTFLIIHGWKITGTNFFADSYPPLLDPTVTEPVDVIIGGSNNGFWNTNITTLYNFNFEFDNVGHLVGKLSFITSQTALLASLQTNMIGSTMLDNLKETDPNILNRVTGRDQEEKQNVIFGSGVPWSREDRAGGGTEENAEAAAAEAIEDVFRQASSLARGSGSSTTGGIDEGTLLSLQASLAANPDVDYSADRILELGKIIEEILEGVSLRINNVRDLEIEQGESSQEDVALFDQFTVDLINELEAQGNNYRVLANEVFYENLFFNFTLLNAANENRDVLAFVPPSGFEVSEDRRFEIRHKGSNLNATQRVQRIQSMGRGYLTDVELSRFRPATSEPLDTSTVVMPQFGNYLQGLIFDEFNQTTNLNYENYNLSKIQSDDVLDETLRNVITNTSVLSLPVVRSESISNVLPDVSDIFENNFDNSLFMIEYTSLGGIDANDPLRDTTPYRISFPINSVEGRSRSVLIAGDNSFVFGNVGGTAPAALKAAENLIINSGARPGQRNSVGVINNNVRFISSQILVLDSGFIIERERPLRNEPFLPASAPIAMVDEDGHFFIRGFDNYLTKTLSDSQTYLRLIKLRDNARNYVQSQDAFRRVSIGFSGNTDYELDGVVYQTYMRPAYFFLGSVFEALSIATNRTVKFYYKPFPKRGNEKAFEINIPDQAGGDASALAILNEQIEAVEREMIRNGYFDGVQSRPLADYNVTMPEESEVDDVIKLYKQGWLEFTLSLGTTVLNGSSRGNGLKQNWEIAGGESAFGSVDNFLNRLGITFVRGLTENADDIRNSATNNVENGELKEDMFIPKMVDNFVNVLINNDEQRLDYERSNRESGQLPFNFYVLSPFELGNGFTIRTGEYTTQATVGDFLNPAPDFTVAGGGLGTGLDERDEEERFDEIIAFSNNFAEQHLAIRGGVPGYNSFDSRVQTVRDDYVNPIEDGGVSRQQLNIDRLATLMRQKDELSVQTSLKDMRVKSAFEVPVNILSVEHMLLSEGNAPSHNLLKKLLDSVQETMPNLRLAMRTNSSDPSYIEIFVSAINDDGVITEIMDEISINNGSEDDGGEVGGFEGTADFLRTSVIRDGSKVVSNNVTVLNFGTSDSLVESFQMSSKLDPMAFATSMTPAILGGASMNVTNILKEGIINRDRDNVLSDIKEILENGVINVDDFKTLQIVSETENAKGKIINKVTDEGLNRLRNILVGESDNIVLQKTAMTLVEELATQNVTLRNKLTALQSEYFNGLDYSVNAGAGDLDKKIIPNSRYAGNILGTFLRSITVTIHGTAGFNVHDYVYIKGTMRGIEGLYIISNVSESVTIGSFTTTLECRLIEYTNNDQQTNPLAYKGEASIRALAEQQRKLASDAEVDIADLASRVLTANDRDN